MLTAMETVTILGIASGVLYGAVNAALAAGLWRGRASRQAGTPRVSVIVAARNEERTLGILLDRLSRQTYPDAEFLIANDRSTDRTGEIISAAAANDPRFRRIDVLPATDGMPGKKNALRAAIAASRGEVLCFTDADCFPQPEWVATLVECFDEKTGMVAGYSPYATPAEAGGWLQRFIAYEEFRGAVWSGGSIGWDRAWLCTGRNLAYRRRVYDEAGGFEAIKKSVSGDDDLFMQHVRRTTPWKIRYCYDPRNAVETLPPSSLAGFVEQRKRHFSAGKFFSWPMKIFFSAYHAANLLLLLLIIAGVVSSELRSLAYGALAMKFVPDAVLASSGASALGEHRLARSFVVMEILYVAYNWLVGPLGFMMSFRWKGDA